MHAVKLLLGAPGMQPLRESVHDNVFWRGAEPQMSVCLPACGRDVSPLLAALSNSDRSALVEFIIYDDGRCSHDLVSQMQAAAGHVPAAVRIVSSSEPRVGMAARGAAAAHARTSWVVLLDCETEADVDLIEAYLEIIGKLGSKVGGSDWLKAG